MYKICLKQALKAKVSYNTWSSGPNVHSFTPATLLPPSHPVPTASGWDPYNQLTEQEHIWAWFIGSCAQYTKTTQKKTAATLQALSRLFLQEKGEEKSSQWEEQEQCTGLFNFLKRRNNHMYNCIFCTQYYVFTGCGQLFGCMVRDLEGTWLKNGWQGSLRKRYVDTPLWMGKNVNV